VFVARTESTGLYWTDLATFFFFFFFGGSVTIGAAPSFVVAALKLVLLLFASSTPSTKLPLLALAACRKRRRRRTHKHTHTINTVTKTKPPLKAPIKIRMETLESEQVAQKKPSGAVTTYPRWSALERPNKPPVKHSPPPATGWPLTRAAGIQTQPDAETQEPQLVIASQLSKTGSEHCQEEEFSTTGDAQSPLLHNLVVVQNEQPGKSTTQLKHEPPCTALQQRESEKKEKKKNGNKKIKQQNFLPAGTSHSTPSRSRHVSSTRQKAQAGSDWQAEQPEFVWQQDLPEYPLPGQFKLEFTHCPAPAKHQEQPLSPVVVMLIKKSQTNKQTKPFCCPHVTQSPISEQHLPSGTLGATQPVDFTEQYADCGSNESHQRQLSFCPQAWHPDSALQQYLSASTAQVPISSLGKQELEEAHQAHPACWAGALEHCWQLVKDEQQRSVVALQKLVRTVCFSWQVFWLSHQVHPASVLTKHVEQLAGRSWQHVPPGTPPFPYLFSY
jgi:hypothetical protein